jgi:UDP-glucose 4-epimerase
MTCFSRFVKALVTGGAGFIGSHLADALVAGGHEVHVVDDLSTGRVDNLESALEGGAELHVEDVTDAAWMAELAAIVRPDVVFHLAAQIDVRASMAEPSRDAEINVVGSINVFSAAAASGARRVINTSTGGAIYGEGAPLPTPETTTGRPLSAYGLSKLTAEQYAEWFRLMHDLDVVTLRYGNVYGPRQDPTGDAGVVAIFCSRLLAGLRPMIFGDGRQTRDYVFVRDIVAANLAAASAQGLAHSIFNIGTGCEVSVGDLVGAVAEAAGVDPALFQPEMRPPRAGEVLRSCLDIARAREELNLDEPTPLHDGLEATLDWIRQRQPVP